jgi:hypothetical protein
MNLPLLSRLSPRWRRTLGWLAVAGVAYSLVGFLLLPWLLKGQLLRRLPELTQRTATIRQVKVNPWTLSLTVRGLELTEADGRPFASWDELYVNFQASSLFRWAWTFREIRLVQPAAEVLLFADGRLNLANLWAAPTNAPPAPAAPPRIPRIRITAITITNGFVAFEDRTRRSPFRTEYRPINLQLRNFTTRPDSETPYSFHAESDAGRSMTWAGDVTVQPLRSAGHLEIVGVQLPRYQPYLEDFTRAVLTNGLAEVRLDYRFAADTNGLDLVLTNLALEVAAAQMLDPDTREIVARLRGLELAGGAFDHRSRTLHIQAVTVSEAELLARRKADGRLNLLDLLVSPPAAATPPPPGDVAQPPPVLTVANFTLERAAVTFEDQTLGAPFQTELKPIEITVKNFSTAPEHDATYSFQATTEAAETFAGTGTFAIQPLRSRGEVTVTALDVKKYLPYLAPFFRGRIVAGHLAARLPYRVTLDARGLGAGVTNLQLTLSDLEVQLPESTERVTHVRQLGFEGVEASLEDRRGRLTRFSGDGGSVVVRRNADRSLNLLGLLAVARTNLANAAASPVPPSPARAGDTNPPAFALGGWTLQVDQIALTNYTVTLEDRVPEPPAKAVLDELALTLRDLSTTAQTPVAFATAFRLNPAGHVAAEGSLQLRPLSAEAAVAVTNLDLRLAQPYLDSFVSLELDNGSLGVRGRVAVSADDPAALRGRFTGGVEIRQFAATDPESERKLVGWEQLQLTGLEAAFPPLTVTLTELRWTRPEANVWVNAEGRPNVTSLLKASPPRGTDNAPSPPPASPSPPADRPHWQLDTLTLDGARLTFRDESVQPPAALSLDQLSGTVKTLSSTLDQPAEVALAGRVDGESPLVIAGRLNPFPAARLVDLTITNANTQLTPLTGYLEKYGGYPLRKGRLSAALRYRVTGLELSADNRLLVDQLTLGPRNDSPLATKLPLKLGIALLKDSDGRIDLDLPLSGRLDDPDFSLAPLVLKVLVNTVVKAAASPFKLLGALAGGGEDDALSFIAFQPGGTNLVEGEFDKLGRLATALAKRPALQLAIEGAVDPRLDRDALARQKLEELLRTRRAQELGRKARRPAAEIPPSLAPEDRERLLRALFAERFGTNVAEVLATNAARFAPTNAPPAADDLRPGAARRRGVFQRITGVFGGGSPPRSKTEKQLPKEDREALELATPDLMAALLAENIEVRPEEFHPLLVARARLVHDWLVGEGQVAGDRLLLVSPKPVDDRYTGRAQVDLSLE